MSVPRLPVKHLFTNRYGNKPVDIVQMSALEENALSLSNSTGGYLNMLYNVNKSLLRFEFYRQVYNHRCQIWHKTYTRHELVT